MSDIVVARNCCMARMLPGEAENGVGMNRSVRGGKVYSALSGPTDWIMRYIKNNYLYLSYIFFILISFTSIRCS